MTPPTRLVSSRCCSLARVLGRARARRHLPAPARRRRRPVHVPADPERRDRRDRGRDDGRFPRAAGRPRRADAGPRAAQAAAPDKRHDGERGERGRASRSPSSTRTIASRSASSRRAARESGAASSCAIGACRPTGLLIANNKHGERTFFSDNWPTKARQLAAHDRPPVRQGGVRDVGDGAVALPGRLERRAGRGDGPGRRPPADALAAVRPDRDLAQHARRRALRGGPSAGLARPADRDLGLPPGPRQRLRALRRSHDGRARVPLGARRPLLRTSGWATSRPTACAAAWSRRRRSSTATTR